MAQIQTRIHILYFIPLINFTFTVVGALSAHNFCHISIIKNAEVNVKLARGAFYLQTLKYANFRLFTKIIKAAVFQLQSFKKKLKTTKA